MPRNAKSRLFMNSKPLLPGPKVFVLGLVAGLVAGWSGGCSKSGSTNVDLKKAREALAKRRADYEQFPRSRLREKHRAPVR